MTFRGFWCTTSKPTVRMFSLHCRDLKGFKSLISVCIDFCIIPFITACDRLSKQVKAVLGEPHYWCILSTSSYTVLSLKASGSSSEMVLFTAKLGMSIAFFPLAGPPESWGCWLPLQETSPLILCSLMFHPSWSSRKRNQSIEGQVSVIFYYDMVLQSFFLHS